MGSKVFVTGANGRVGQRLVAALVAAGDQVTGLARSADKAREVEALGAACLVGDLSSRDVLEQGLDGAEVVYHLAGGLRGPGPQQTPDLVNRAGMQGLLDAVDRVGTGSLNSLVFTSTCAVYGDRSGLVVGEDMPPQPDTRYGKSKVAAEQLLAAACDERGVPGRIVRLAAVYGPGFPFMLADQIAAGTARLPGEGRNYVPTIHIDDAVTGLRAVAGGGVDGAIYNLADRAPLTLRDFYAEVHRHVGGAPVRFFSTWIPSYVQEALARTNERVASRLGRHPRLTPDNLKLFRASARMRVDRIEQELSMEWAWPSAREGLADVLAPR
ncbi:MAG: NAD-dependent epimerase/dehydratase family protein [Alphaproteobacteria bacterium]|nr:NAD-dependent epimerase/dehydratase family protein [Alphaproteobacteria bacterium]